MRTTTSRFVRGLALAYVAIVPWSLATGRDALSSRRLVAAARFDHDLASVLPSLLGGGEPELARMLDRILLDSEPTRVIGMGTRAYCRLGAGPPQVLDTSPLLLISFSRDGGALLLGQCDTFHEYWDRRCLEDRYVALRTGELMYELNARTRVAYQRLAYNLLHLPEHGFRRASFALLTRDAGGETHGFDWTEHRSRTRPIDEPYCGYANQAAVRRWLQWAREHDPVVGR